MKKYLVWIVATVFAVLLSSDIFPLDYSSDSFGWIMIDLYVLFLLLYAGLGFLYYLLETRKRYLESGAYNYFVLPSLYFTAFSPIIMPFLLWYGADCLRKIARQISLETPLDLPFHKPFIYLFIAIQLAGLLLLLGTFIRREFYD